MFPSKCVFFQRYGEKRAEICVMWDGREFDVDGDVNTKELWDVECKDLHILLLFWFKVYVYCCFFVCFFFL